MGYKNPYADEEHVCDNKSCCPGRFITKLESLKLNSFWRIIVTALFGVIAAFGFAPFHLWLLSLIGIGGMYYFTIKRTRKINFWKSWLFAFPFGAAYGVVMFWWVLNSIYVIPELAAKFAIWTLPGLIGIALICGIILSLPFAVIRYVSRKPANRAILFAASWVLVL